MSCIHARKRESSLLARTRTRAGYKKMTPPLFRPRPAKHPARARPRMESRKYQPLGHVPAHRFEAKVLEVLAELQIDKRRTAAVLLDAEDDLACELPGADRIVDCLWLVVENDRDVGFVSNGNLHRHFLRPLGPLEAKLCRLYAQHSGDGHAVILGMENGEYEM